MLGGRPYGIVAGQTISCCRLNGRKTVGQKIIDKLNLENSFVSVEINALRYSRVSRII